MTDPGENKNVLLEKNRMESLTDGIFGFAMTLLVTSMILPRNAVVVQGSGDALASLLPEFYHYIIAFFVLAGFWMGHHEQFSRIHHIDNRLLYLNIVSLFFVTLVPFSTSFVGDYDADMIATCVFEINLLILGLLFSLQWLYASRKHRLIPADYPEPAIRRRLYHGMILPVVSAAGILITLAGISSSTMIYMATPVISYAVEKYR